jgi:hypothetical protein
MLYSGDKPPSTKEIIKNFYDGNQPPYDFDSLCRFMNKVIDNKHDYDADTMGAAKALRDALAGASLPKIVGLKFKKRTEADGRYTIHNPASSIVVAALNNEFPNDGKTQRQHAEAEIAELFSFSLRAAQDYYDRVKDSAARSLESYKKIYASAGWGEFRAKPVDSKSIEVQIRELADSTLTYNEKIKLVELLTGKPRMEAQQIYKATIKQ